MNLDLSAHHEKYLIPVIKSRLKTLRNKTIKDFGANWGDYEQDQIDSKVSEKNDEYIRLSQILRKLTSQSN